MNSSRVERRTRLSLRSRSEIQRAGSFGLIAYSAPAAEHMVTHPRHREQTLQKTCKALGGKLLQFYYCFGEYDALVIVELPNNKAAAALSLSADASGAVKLIKTTVLLTVDEAKSRVRILPI